MAAQQCRESRHFHGIICCYIGFAFFSPCKFQTGNPSRRCALQGSLWAGLAACCHAFLARSPGYPGFWRCFPKSGTAEDAIQLSREKVYLLSITMDSVGAWEWEGVNKKYFCGEQMVQWFQEMFIIKRIEWFCFKWNMWLLRFAKWRWNKFSVWGRIAINDEDVNLYYIAEAAISRISEMCYDVLFDKSFPVTIET